MHLVPKFLPIKNYEDKDYTDDIDEICTNLKKIIINLLLNGSLKFIVKIVPVSEYFRKIILQKMLLRNKYTVNPLLHSVPYMTRSDNIFIII